MRTAECSNCGRELAQDFNVCPNCGQKTDTHRFSIKHIIEEILHAFTHADKGVFPLMRGLIIRPGVVLTEYIAEGKRKKYFNPFTFLLIVLGFSVFMNSIFHPYQKNQTLMEKKIETAETAQKKAIYQSMATKTAKFNEFLEKKTNLVIFFTAPFMALAFWLVFKGKRFNYAEHLVAYLILTSMLSLVSSIVFIPLMSKMSAEVFYIGAVGNLVLQLAYTSFAYTRFLQLKGFGEILMVSVANILGITLWMMMMTIALFVYMLAF